MEPETKPSEPETKPSEPETKPSELETKPSEPETNSSEAGSNPPEAGTNSPATQVTPTDTAKLTSPNTADVNLWMFGCAVLLGVALMGVAAYRKRQ